MIVDSTIPIIATEQIGEAWSTVILAEIAKGRVDGATDALMILEILNAYAARGARYEGKRLATCFRRCLADRIATVTVDDFDRAAALRRELPSCQPRELIHAALAIRLGDRRIFSVDGPPYDDILPIDRVNLPRLLKELRLKGDHLEPR